MEILVFLFIAWWLYNLFTGGEQGRKRRQFETEIKSQLDKASKGLTLKVKRESYKLENSTEEVFTVSASGTLVVPHANYQTLSRITMIDITDGEENPKPILCLISELANENGIFMRSESETIPYEISTLEDFQLVVVPIRALLFPKRGLRKLMLILDIVSANNPDQTISYGQRYFEHNHDLPGYMEMEQASLEQAELMAVLALSVAAADGHIDKAEKLVIRRFFAERYAGEDSEEDLVNHVNTAMTETYQILGKESGQARKLAKDTASKMNRHAGFNYRRNAFKLCMQVAAADGDMASTESKTLDEIAELLDLSPEIIKEIRDKNTSYTMYNEDNLLLDMPLEIANGTKQAQCTWISEEYKRWHPRLDHRDETIQTEAALRVERLVNLRMKLDC